MSHCLDPLITHQFYRKWTIRINAGFDLLNLPLAEVHVSDARGRKRGQRQQGTRSEWHEDRE